MIQVTDFAILQDLEKAPPGLYKLTKTAINGNKQMVLCFENEMKNYAEIGVSYMENHIVQVIQIPKNNIVKICQ